MSLNLTIFQYFSVHFHQKIVSIQQHHLVHIGIFHILYLRLTVAAMIQGFKLLILGKLNHISL